MESSTSTIPAVEVDKRAEMEVGIAELYVVGRSKQQRVGDRYGNDEGPSQVQSPHPARDRQPIAVTNEKNRFSQVQQLRIEKKSTKNEELQASDFVFQQKRRNCTIRRPTFRYKNSFRSRICFLIIFAWLYCIVG